MINLSTEFKNELLRDSRKFLPYLDIMLADGTVINLEKKDIWQNSLQVEDATSASEVFTIGAAVTGKLKVTINNIYDEFSEYDFYNAKVTAYIGLQLSDTLEKAGIGIFTVDEPSYDGSTISLSCLDNMSKFDKPYTKSTLQYPASLGIILQDACDCCGVTLASANFPNKDYIVKARPKDDALTFGDIIAMAAQIAGCWAKMDVYGRLKLGWYNMSVFEQNAGLDGGTFDGAKPYKTGDSADGGNFTNYSFGDDADGGTFDDQKQYHHIFATKSFSMSTDDVVITGVRVVEEFEETETEKRGTYLAGQEGYLIEISGNALIQKGQAKKVADYLYGRIGGMQFRPFQAECLTDPSIEAGDIAYVTDRKQNSYRTFISTRSFTLGGAERIACDAETPMKNSQKRFSEMMKVVVKARQMVEVEKTERELAVESLAKELATSSGLFMTKEKQTDGSDIYYMHDKRTLSDSVIVWKLTSNAFGISTDGGKTYPYGLDVNGMAILNRIYAIGINADYINAGTITGCRINNGNGTFSVDQNGVCIANNFKSASAEIIGGHIRIDNNNQDKAGNLIRFTTGSQKSSGLALDSQRMIFSSDGMLPKDGEVYGVVSLHGNGHASIDFTGFSVHAADGNYSSLTNHGITTNGSFVCDGTKSRSVNTADYGARLLYCYETPSPMFGDIGEGQLDETGKCIIFIDDIFSETVDIGCQYQVFLQAYGDGSVYVSERTPSYFIVSGTPSVNFGWELKAVQRDYDTMRLEPYTKDEDDFIQENNSETVYNYLTSLLYDVESEEVE